ncbi:MAG: MBL fold metallo-hydrolase [Anaerolineales bacterium]|nr:MAG: MBL fold metallo-hydrolase [Anaerolineales bacterium]
MRRERVSDDIYVFTSDLYAQVTASAVATEAGIIVIDTLPFPEETRLMKDFLEGLGRGKIRYLINTHWHGDHTHGSFLFEGVQLVGHQKCAEALLELGAVTLQESKESSPELEDVELKVPDITFDEGDMLLHLGGKSLQMVLTPGHTPDSTVVYVQEDKVFLAADTVMPLPYFVWGNREDFITSLQSILEFDSVESVVQGHGEVLLRGEIQEVIQSSINYLEVIYERVKRVVDAGQGLAALGRIDIESCGMSRIPLNGLVQDLHQANLYALYQDMTNSSQG